MQVNLMKSKLHKATITETLIDYEGSIAIDEDLMESAGILPNEQVHVFNVNNGQRFITYAIKGTRGSKTIAVNGAAARLVHLYDRIIIVAYGIMDYQKAKDFEPKVLLLDAENNIVKSA
jgi:aspartate 1-decarboxylase